MADPIIPVPEGAPVLRSEAMHMLYLVGKHMPVEAYHDFLRELPHESLAADICTILQWGIDDYERLSSEEEAPRESVAVMHAYIFAGAVGRPEVVPCLLQLLAAPEEVLEFYFGDMLTEECWWPLYQYLPAALGDYMAFLRRHDVYEFSKSAVLAALLYSPYSGSEGSEQIMPALTAYAQERVAVSKQQLQALPDFTLTDIALRLIDDGTEEGLAVGKSIFEAGLAAEEVAGNLEEVLKDRGCHPNLYSEVPCKNLEEVYASLKGYSIGWHEDDFNLPNRTNKAFPPNDPNQEFYLPQQPIVKGEKIGRNDPCHCGSGKKYKKCCLGKE